MKKIVFSVSDETFQTIQLLSDDRRKKGRIWLEFTSDNNRCLRLELYRQTSKRNSRTLYETPFGTLSETEHDVKLSITAPKRVGWHRAAELLLGDAKESAAALHQLAETELLNEPLNPDFQ